MNICTWYSLSRSVFEFRAVNFEIKKYLCHSEDRASWYILIIKPTRYTNFSNVFIFGMELYMFRKGFLHIIRSLVLYTQRQGSYRLCWLLAGGIRKELTGFIIKTYAQFTYPIISITIRYTGAIFRPSHEMIPELRTYRTSAREAYLNVSRYTPCGAVVELITGALLQWRGAADTSELLQWPGAADGKNQPISN